MFFHRSPAAAHPPVDYRSGALALGCVVAMASVCDAQLAASARPAETRAPLTLRSVLSIASRSNPLVTAAEGRLRAARGSRITAGTFGNPIVTYQVENAPFPGRASPVGLDAERSTFATLPLEPLWQRGLRVRRAGGDVQAAEANLVATRRQVMLDAARAFHRVALAQASRAASADVLAGLDSLVRYTTARVKEGATAEGDLLRLQVERERVATEQAMQEAELAQARALLQPYLVADPSAPSGEPAARDLVVGDDAGGAVASDASALPARDDVARRALLARPDVLAAQARARGAGAEVGLQRTLSVRQLGATFGNKRINGSNSLIAGLSLPIPLFDQNRGEIQRAQGERTAAEQELAWTTRRAMAEVVGAYDAAQVLSTQVATLQKGFLARAEESRRVALAAYREGAAPLLQVLDATRTLGDARLTYLRARYAQQDAILALYVAAGLDPADALSKSPATGATAP
jgi:outer membrane protein, heavy metal efflux system